MESTRSNDGISKDYDNNNISKNGYDSNSGSSTSGNAYPDDPKMWLVAKVSDDWIMRTQEINN